MASLRLKSLLSKKRQPKPFRGAREVLGKPKPLKPKDIVGSIKPSETDVPMRRAIFGQAFKRARQPTSDKTGALRTANILRKSGVNAQVIGTVNEDEPQKRSFTVYVPVKALGKEDIRASTGKTLTPAKAVQRVKTVVASKSPAPTKVKKIKEAIQKTE
jgi:hypothetical protein